MPLYFTSATDAHITVPELLSSRDARQARQQQWLLQQAVPLISFTVVAPGAVKDTELTRRIFNHGLRALRQLLEQSGWEIKQQHCVALPTGAEGLLAVKAPAHSLKKATIKLEQTHPLGRLWDIDVLTPEGKILSRSDFSLTARRCLLCEDVAAVCARERTHSVSDLLTRMEALLHDADNPAYA